MESSPSQSSKRLSTKAATPLEILCGEVEQINPAILLADELMRKGAAAFLSPEYIEQAEAVLLYSRQEIGNVQRQLSALVNTRASASVYVPVGF